MPGLLTVAMERVTGLAADRVVNTFAINGYQPGLNAQTDEDLAYLWKEFYGTVATGALVEMDRFLSGTLSRATGAMEISLYDITGHENGEPHGSPVHVTTHQLNAPPSGVTPLPDEVAACITLEAQGREEAAVEQPNPGGVPPTRRPKSRRTGRIFFGPLNSSALEVVDGRAVVANAFRDTARLAIVDLQVEIEALIPGAALGVWSRRDAVVREVDWVFVDSDFDTQRRRQLKPTIRERTAVPS